MDRFELAINSWWSADLCADREVGAQTINEAKMKLRKDRRHLCESIDEGRPGDDCDYIPKGFADWRQIPSEALEQKELCDALTTALNSLPEKYRTVLILRDVQHLSITEAA